MTQIRRIAEIIVDPKVHFGKPVIRGTRVPVEVVVGKVAGGMEVEEVAQEYDITRHQVMAALRYAAAIVAGEEIVVS